MAYDIGRAFLDLLGWASPALVLLAFVVLAFGVHAPKAYALSARNAPEMVIDGNMVGDDAGSKGYLCVNCSPYTATLELIGHYSDIIQITDEQYSWLMGGNNPFATLADKWKELKGGESDEPTNTWLGDDGFIDGWLILAGKGNCWYGTFTDNQIRMAEIAFNSIMQGGTGEEGGGTGGGTADDTGMYKYGLVAKYPFRDGTAPSAEIKNAKSWYVNADGKGIASGTSSGNTLIWSEGEKQASVALDPYSYNLINDWIENSNIEKVYSNIFCGSSGSYVIISDGPIVFVPVNKDSYVCKNESDTTQHYYRWRASSGNLYNVNDSLIFGCFSIGSYDSVTVASGGTSGTGFLYMKPYWVTEGDSFLDDDGGDDQPPDVPKPPDDPEPPSPTPPTPDPPKPKDPTPRDPTPKPDPPRVYPKIDLPDVHITTEPTNTEPTDYTPWLRAIYNELKAFHEDFGTYFQDLLDELENHCQHIRDEISTQASYLGDCIEDVANEVSQQGNNLSNTIWEYADWLSKYMDAFGEWLVEHLSWNNEVNVDPYDDTSLMYWIRRIYTKLGGSNQPVNSRPTDPVLNPKDTGNWLNELWETILKELAQVFPNLMIDLGLIFDDLKSKFPFSIPWDIHALLLLLVTEPVAPHFTIPMYSFTTSYELEQIGEYDIDLSFYTDYLMGVHLMLEIAWIGYMLKHTKDYMELIEAVIPS